MKFLNYGMAHGNGTKRWTSGDIHYGAFKDGQAQGPCIRIWDDGDRFSGEWEKDEWVCGTYSWPSMGDEAIAGRYIGEKIFLKKNLFFEKNFC